MTGKDQESILLFQDGNGNWLLTWTFISMKEDLEADQISRTVRSYKQIKKKQRLTLWEMKTSLMLLHQW